MASWQSEDAARLRYFRVVYRGGIRIRREPTEATGGAPDSMRRVLPEGTVLRGAPTSDGNFVQLCSWPRQTRQRSSYASFAAPDRDRDRDHDHDEEEDDDDIDVDGAGFDAEGVLGGAGTGLPLRPDAWLPVSAKGKLGLEPALGRRDEAGEWWYRVVGSEGMQFAATCALDSPRLSAVHPVGAVVRGQRKCAPPGSRVSFVELADGLGWLFEATESRELLDRFNGKPVVAEASPEERTEGADVYFRVKHKGGLRVRRHPTLTGEAPAGLGLGGGAFGGGGKNGGKNGGGGGGGGFGGGRGKPGNGKGGELLLFNTVFVGDVILKPAGVDHTFVRLSDGRGWVCAVKGSGYGGPLPPTPPVASSASSVEVHRKQLALVKQLPPPRLTAELLSSPFEERGDFWFQVISDAHPVPVLEAPSPNSAMTGKQMGLGMIFGSGKRVKPLGCPHTFVELNTADVSGWVSERAIHGTLQMLQQRRKEEEEAAAAAAAAAAAGGGGQPPQHMVDPSFELHQQHVVGKPPDAAADDRRWPPVLARVSEPKWAEGPFYYQVLYPGGLRVRINPHARAATLPQEIVPPYSVVKIDGALDVYFHRPSSSSSSSSSSSTSLLAGGEGDVESPPAASSSSSSDASSSSPPSAASSSSGSGGSSSSSSSSGGGGGGETHRFLKLFGRGGWLLTSHGGRAVARRVAGPPAEDVGRFVYRVVAPGGAEVRHGPTATAPLLGCTLPHGTELTATLRLRFPREVAATTEEDGRGGGGGGGGAAAAAGNGTGLGAGRGVFVSFMLPKGTTVAGSTKGPSNKPIPGWLRVLDDDDDYEDYGTDNDNDDDDDDDDDDSEGGGGEEPERRRSSRGIAPLLELVSEEIDSTMAGVALAGSGGGGMIRTGGVHGTEEAAPQMSADTRYHIAESGGGEMLTLDGSDDRRCVVS